MRHSTNRWSFSRQFVALSLVLLAGCSDGKQLEKLGNDIARLEQENAALRSDLQAIQDAVDSAARLKDLEAAFQGQSEAWERFQAAYEPSTREELRKNVDASTEILQALQSANETASGRLKTLEEHVANAEQLKKLCAEHEASAKQLDTIGPLQASVNQLETEVKKQAANISRVESAARRAQSTADTASSKASSAESLARQRR
ncbi:MAG: hypothetical protein NT069_29370 [Planctomycetota bacterium]|nr:hypothetical protein [Planctomycetota bacterium]